MKITPVEIRNQEFKRSMRGYDAVEVDTFLELIANEFSVVIQENENLTKQLIKFEAELKNYKEVEKTLKQTLYNVQETSQISKENSQKEALLIRKEAELAAAQMLEKSRMEVHKMREEVISLQNQKQSLISRLRHLLSSQIELLDVLGMDDLDMAKLKDRTRKVSGTEQAEENRVKFKKPEPEKKSPKLPAETQGPVEDNPPGNQGDDFFNDIFGEDSENEESSM